MARRVVAAVLALGALLGCSPTPTWPTDERVFRVSELLAARAEGRVSAEPVLLGGYWSNPSVAHSCQPPEGPVGKLQIYCHDGEFGITERGEPIITVDGSQITPTDGPHLTPWVPDHLLARLSPPPGRSPADPVPVIVRGHFDDPAAGGCHPRARQLCLDRFVVDEVIGFGH